jgi:hypothetical protein
MRSTRSKLTLVIFTFLLLAQCLAAAAIPSEMTAPLMALASPLEDLSCSPLLAKLSLSTLSSQDTATIVCGTGSCSVTICQGAPLHSICKIGAGGALSRCENVSGKLCPTGGVECSCFP